MDNKVFLLGLFLLSVANVKAQTQTQNDSLTMENMMHNLPEIMIKGSRPIVKAERGMLSYNMPLLMKQLPADNAYYSKTNIPESLEISIFPCRGANLEWMHNINLLTAIHMVNLHA